MPDEREENEKGRCIAQEKEAKQTTNEPRKVGGTTQRDKRTEAKLKPTKERKRRNPKSKERQLKGAPKPAMEHHRNS